jgi:hypothetical protein
MKPGCARSRMPVTLWVFNHSFRYISDQLSFLVSTLSQHGYCVQVSNRPSLSALNIVIENFSATSVERIASFCRAHQKRVAVVLTEHMDFVDGRILFHGSEIGSEDDYFAPEARIQRLAGMLALRDSIRTFFRLGDLPALHNLGKMIPGLSVHSLPFPLIKPVDRTRPEPASRREAQFDLIFTGTLTSYRRRILSDLSKGYNIYVSGDPVSRRRRDALNSRGKLVLNIPQNRSWGWISTMRVLAALHCARLTVAIGDFAASAIDPYCVRIAQNEAGAAALRDILETYDELFHEHMDAYQTFVTSERNSAFPHHLFENWANLEL